MDQWSVSNCLIVSLRIATRNKVKAPVTQQDNESENTTPSFKYFPVVVADKDMGKYN